MWTASSCLWRSGCAPTDADAFVLACFSDPGLHASREAVGGRPVMGIAEWGLLRALTLGERFGIIALSPASVQRQQRYVRQMGLQDRYAGSWPVGASAAETAGEAVRERLAEAGKNLTTRFGADVIVLGCAGMAGHRRALQDLIGRPVVEPTQQAVAAAIGALLLAEFIAPHPLPRYAADVAALAERGRRSAPHFPSSNQAEPTRSATASTAEPTRAL